MRTVLKNPRNEPVRIELVEFFSARQIALKLPSGAERTPQGYRLELVLKPGETRTFDYTVTLRY